MPHGKGVCLCPKHQTRNTIYRRDWVEIHGDGPQVCNMCGRTREFSEGDIDHKDGDRSNSDPSNLQFLCHSPCHLQKSRSEDSKATKDLHIARFKAINADPEIRRQRSERAKRQWAEGNLGRKAK